MYKKHTVKHLLSFINLLTWAPIGGSSQIGHFPLLLKNNIIHSILSLYLANTLKFFYFATTPKILPIAAIYLYIYIYFMIIVNLFS
jgi:hypothetical protein